MNQDHKASMSVTDPGTWDMWMNSPLPFWTFYLVERKYFTHENKKRIL